MVGKPTVRVARLAGKGIRLRIAAHVFEQLAEGRVRIGIGDGACFVGQRTDRARRIGVVEPRMGGAQDR